MEWKDDFLKLYMSADNNKVLQAIDLKEMYIPQYLYRYRSAKEAKFVQSELFGQIYMPHISELNDPFDSCALLESENINDYFRKDDFVEILEDATGLKIPDDMMNPDTWSEDIIDYVLSAQGVNKEKKKEAIESYRIDARKRLEHANSKVNEMIKSGYRIACFSETPVNLPMWNHYANGHKGICLEYDTLKFRYDCTLRQRLFPVYYQDKLPDILELMKDMDSKRLPVSLIDYILIHKLKDWSYEKEWRLIRNFRQEANKIEKLPDDYWSTGKVEFLTKPSKVYLGAKIDQDMKILIIALCVKLKIDIYQMECTEYGLKEHAIKKWEK